MAVIKEDSGRRSVRLEFEVPGTPEQVWQAIATGPGITSWFAPADVEEHVGGAITFHFGQGMDSSGTVTAWEPPLRFAYEERDWGENAPPLATELLVETRAGGTCVVRMVHSLFASGDEWDSQLEGFEAGWPPFFHILRLVLTHFQGQRCSALRLMGEAPGSEAEAWEEMAGALGVAGAAVGERRSSPASAGPPLAGVIERKGEGKHAHEIMLRLEEPAPGIALAGVYTWGGKVNASISFYLFGERGAAAAARDEPLWQAWMSQRFPAAVAASTVA